MTKERASRIAPGRQSTKVPKEILRAVLFVDYENARSAARDLFQPDGGASGQGHFSPRELGATLCRRFNRGRTGKKARLPRLELSSVRVYWGHFWGDEDAGHQQAHEQEARFDAWQDPPANRPIGDADVEVIAPMRHQPAPWYPTEREREHAPWRQIEKEVDTAIAVDMLSMAHAGEFDVAILFSEDGDLRAVVCEILDRFSPNNSPQIHLAGWELSLTEEERAHQQGAARSEEAPRTKPDSVLYIPKDRLPQRGRMPYVHRLRQPHYEEAADSNNYKVPRDVWREIDRRLKERELVRVHAVTRDERDNKLYVNVTDMDAPVKGFISRHGLPGGGDADLEEWVGRSFDAVISALHDRTGRVEFSVSAAARASFIDSLREGDVCRGRICRIDGSAGLVWVDVGHDIKGCIPKAELFWGESLDPLTALKRRGEVDVEVVKHDLVKQEIMLSTKRTWGPTVERLRKADWVTGTVAKVSHYGEFAWVYLEGSVVGVVRAPDLEHLTNRKIGYVEEAGVYTGTVLPFKIKDVRDNKHEVDLSVNQALEAAKRDGWEFDSFGRASKMPPHRVAT